MEEDPKEILATCYECFERVIENLRKMSIDPANMKAVGITNQRETTVVWDRITGEPLYPAISKKQPSLSDSLYTDDIDNDKSH